MAHGKFDVGITREKHICGIARVCSQQRIPKFEFRLNKVLTIRQG